MVMMMERKHVVVVVAMLILCNLTSDTNAAVYEGLHKDTPLIEFTFRGWETTLWAVRDAIPSTVLFAANKFQVYETSIRDSPPRFYDKGSFVIAYSNKPNATYPYEVKVTLNFTRGPEKECGAILHYTGLVIYETIKNHTNRILEMPTIWRINGSYRYLDMEVSIIHQ